MERAKEGQDALPPGRVARQLDRCLDRLGARVGQEQLPVRLCRRAIGHRGDQLLAEPDHRLVVEIGASHMDKAGGLLLDGADDARV